MMFYTFVEYLILDKRFTFTVRKFGRNEQTLL